MDRRGWLDTGQHFTVSRGGFAMEGRHRSLEIVRAGRQQVEGAHCTGQNVVAVGIENEGTYTAVDPPPALWNRLRDLCAWICNRYGIPPTELYGHRDFKNTACPGDRLYALLPRLRTRGGRGARAAGLGGGEGVVAAAAGRATAGPEVTAAQYLLRDARATTAAPTGVFDAATDAAVRRFQAATGAEEVNGLLGGESWPVLARTTLRGTGGDADRAVDALVAVRGAEGVPDLVTAPALAAPPRHRRRPREPDPDPHDASLRFPNGESPFCQDGESPLSATVSPRSGRGGSALRNTPTCHYRCVRSAESAVSSLGGHRRPRRVVTRAQAPPAADAALAGSPVARRLLREAPERLGRLDVVGPAGTGKSVLLDALADVMERAGHTVLRELPEPTAPSTPASRCSSTTPTASARPT